MLFHDFNSMCAYPIGINKTREYYLKPLEYSTQHINMIQRVFKYKSFGYFYFFFFLRVLMIL